MISNRVLTATERYHGIDILSPEHIIVVLSANCNSLPY